MLPAIVVENLPRLVRAIKLLPRDPREDAALNLADELTGITAMVAEKFTNERTADGIQKALYLTVGGVSLGLEQAVTHEGDQAALDFLVEHGAEHAFQVGFRLIKDLSQLPEDALVGEYDQDPVYLQRRLRELFIDICQADPNQNWAGYEKYALQLQQRKEVQAVVRLAGWLRRHHDNGPVSDSDLNAEGVIALAIIFAIEGGGRIIARTGQKEFERFVRSVRKNKPDFEEGWAALVAKVPVQHHPVLLDRIDSYRRSCTVVHKILTRASMKSLFEDLENYAGSELDADYS
ncbi:hypothetical protein ACWYXK_20810 [Janthinobacterium lividum]|jgi:hypothetical protein|uniref:Uncharacterized protein n=1 Tax=Janthinobacterium lividum TaxID=29581 RepID=A0AAJ4MV87_9BURK|nr:MULTISPECIES: hypothetical protein [Janthinobacterium]KAB0331500.1 hypothetical protein F3B38_07250 [Janthinobacterium lividum]KHA78907.1 hypothetical protein NC77_08860 [Janthinobacterium lividum]MBR7636044.1 hypothetical protein [Janthinobacterium lividum]MCC7698629.1 hypothetical protein [Janthinobacterium sp. EB271-G4-7A]MCC7714594.1 hypothetical protein [Janthinobacterium lividum]